MPKVKFGGYSLILVFPVLFCSPAAGGQDQIFKCSPAGLHPTQLAVGMDEVRKKTEELRKLTGKELEKYEKKNPEPTVKGPGGTLYIIDHHHLALALLTAGAAMTYCTEAADYSGLEAADFWVKMEDNKWVYTYDENGLGPLPYSELPASVGALKDDPYRSLAGAVRKAGGYAKTDKPFAEFKWADFFRDKFTRKILESDFGGCVKKAVKIAHSSAAAGLPGYRK